ncbi:MAG: CPBP family intramembrane metalloprotease [Flavobacteriaceae bacterium]|jgi:membrane protease YdiL (CAAX protease family)|nr:CPBP family intramembrane metalloprotease [Flavobacteriaceae bacterium]
MNNNELKLNAVDILLILALSVLAQFVTMVLTLPAKIFHFDEFLLMPIAEIALYAATFAAYYFLVMKPRNQVFRFRFAPKQIGLFPVVILMFTGMIIVAESVISLMPDDGVFFGKLHQLMSDALWGNFERHPLITIFLAAILAPVLEELFFRGLILKGLLNNNVKPVWAIVVSAAIFGGVHIFPWQVVGGFLAGLILGLVFYKTGTLFWGIILHVFNNLSGIILYIRYGGEETSEIFHFNSTLYFSTGLILLLIFGYLYLKFTKNHQWNSY